MGGRIASLEGKKQQLARTGESQEIIRTRTRKVGAFIHLFRPSKQSQRRESTSQEAKRSKREEKTVEVQTDRMREQRLSGEAMQQ